MVIAKSGLLAGNHGIANDKLAKPSHSAVHIFVLRQIKDFISKLISHGGKLNILKSGLAFL